MPARARKRSPARRDAGKSAARRPDSKAARSQRWAARVERRTKERSPGDAPEAARIFRERLSLAEQLALTRELVETRGAELCRAYRDVVAVSYGLRRRRNDDTGAREVIREPCVTLVVKKKWPKKKKWPTNSRVAKLRLPEHLFAYWTADGTRTLCAVGTDVEDVAERAAIRPHAAPRKIVADTDAVSTSGVITCAVDRSTSSDPHAVSCQHVFNLSEVLAPDRFRPATVRIDGGAKLGTTEDVRGPFGDAVAQSLDCQLALVTDSGQLGAALGGLRIDGHLTNPDQALALAQCWIHTPDGPIVSSVKEVVHSEYGFDYGNKGAHDIRHEMLFLVHTASPTKPGYSGSPVSTQEDGGDLIGMHIGGNETDLSIVIPAWHVLDPGRYSSTQPGETWTTR